ncbi:CinA family protein [Stieleria sp. TO1_6]|uniref:CinA family protein n=1 Tax=Stieleria tagensis TaxID=2956795 RepID=UPI00209AA5A1|nr:CinA family protein [Stieleria tagensis]MCO8125000.1 CinA family protein [Stieleria tagensis]
MDLESAAVELVELLAAQQQQLVLAESCTGGLVAATLATVPGVSQWLSGSMVVYQDASKVKWLGVASDIIERHTSVSAPVAHQMVGGALHQTPQAGIAAAVTGHLGPDAPPGMDGVFFLGVGLRGQSPRTWQLELKANKRVGRQREAAQAVIDTLVRVLRRGATDK